MKVNKAILDDILSQPFFRGRILSASMSPLIEVGDEILVDVKSEKLKRFDVIVFVQDDVLVCHYIWRINYIVEPKLIQTRSLLGKHDFPIGFDKYVGKVVSHSLSFWQILRILIFY